MSAPPPQRARRPARFGYTEEIVDSTAPPEPATCPHTAEKRYETLVRRGQRCAHEIRVRNPFASL